ncbi:hypothetical protein [Chitinimonas koreensis]|uniref:hypothetical protein n=1 Tax=Chitinimonas koreensis TaxID=356302 RepID=UPI0012FC7215|nr:hypothetical protein [Chitinimonas koreensis]QNM95544.1 hypothetical protein H9L41_16965 [Chitinimonas koreensis]
MAGMNTSQSHYPLYPHWQTFAAEVRLRGHQATLGYQAACGLRGVLTLLAADDAEHESIECDEEGGRPLEPTLRADLVSAALALVQTMVEMFEGAETGGVPSHEAGSDLVVATE